MSEPGVAEGQVLGRYELLLRVAQGGMARVWAARLHGTRGFRKLVAVKTILPGVMDGDRLEQMFLEEATLASGIHHPNVVDTIELGEQDGVLYMALEWVDGEPLSLLMTEAAKTGGIPLPIAVNLIGQACKGLHAAHELTDEHGEPLGVVHRDISPHNILVTYNGIAKVVDFGIAKATQRSSELTTAGEVKGKLAYMAPEQVKGQAIDRRTDVFALGTILYALTAGRHPWKGDHPGATAARLCSSRPAKPPSSFCPDYPPALELVVLKALNKDPNFRYATAHEFLCALEEALPNSLEGNAEARISEFMKELCGARGVERRKQIRLAGELLDQRRALTGTMTTATATGGSTSAVMLDGVHRTGASTIQPGTSPTGQNPLQPVARRRFDKAVWIAIAAVAASVAVFATRTRDAHEEPRAAAVAPPPAAPLTAAPVETPKAEAAPSASAAAEIDDESELEGGKRKKTKGDARATRTARAFVPPAAAAAPNPAAPTSDPAAPADAATPAPTPAPAASANAWNPKTFGNRY
ncbi:MAG TPA: serine/threonine-protein kinase [Polyangiaceae bacterium]